MTNNSKSKTPPQNPRTYLISSVQLTDIMRYLMTRPYGEVYSIMSTISMLKPMDSNGGENVGKK